MGWKVKERQRYALIEQDSEDPRKHKGTFYLGPRHVKHHSTKEFVEFSYVTTPSFASEKDCRVFAQNSHVAIEVYDYCTKLFDPDYKTVSVYDKRFIVQYQKGTRWRDVDAYNPTIHVIPLEDGVEIKRIFDTDYGQQTLEISHIIKTGRRLKHNIVFTNKTAGTETFRVVMKLAGITHTKVRHEEGETDISKEVSIGRQPFFFIGGDEQHLTLTEYLWSLGVSDAETGEWMPTKLEDIVFDVHAEGCKADIIIGNYSLGENESLLVDPDSDTWQVGASNDDCATRKQTGSWYSRTASYIRVGYFGSSFYAYGGGVRFTGINIAQGAAIDHACLKLTCKTSRSGTTCNSKISAEDVDNAAEFPDNADDFDTRYNNHTSAMVDWDDIPAWTAETEYTSPEMKTVIQEVIDREGWSSGSAIAIFWEDFDDRSTHASYCNREAYSYDGSSSKTPKLEVTWTSGGQTYTKTWNADTLFKKLGVTKTTVVDSAFKKPDILKAFGLDLAFLKTEEVQRQVDAFFKKLDVLQTFGLDVQLLKEGVLKSFAIDVRFAAVVTYTIQKQIDALFKKLGITKGFTVYVDFQKTEQLQRQIDALFRSTLTVQKQIHALFQKLNVLREFGVDVDFLKRDVIKSFAIDARFSAVTTHTINRQIDVLFRKFGTTKTFVVDAEFLKTQWIQRQINALFLRSFAVQKQISALFEKIFITQKQVDAVFKKPGVQKTMSIDVIFRHKVKLPPILGITLDGQLVIPIKKEVWIER